MAATIKLKSNKPNNHWISGYEFECLLKEYRNKILSGKKALTFNIPAKTRLPLETIVRLLNVSNQFSHRGYKTKLKFHGKDNNAMSYCDRMGLFEHLANEVIIDPKPPECSRSSMYNNRNNGLSELEIVNSVTLNKELPKKLSDIIISHLKDVELSERKKLGNIYRTIFSELTTNIVEHSKTKLDGFVAMQLYKNGRNPRAELIICDSGLGLLETLRPSLKKHNKKYESYSDDNLIVEMLTNGISSKDPIEGGGNGLETCFRHAKKMNSDLSIRLHDSQYRLFKVSEQESLINALRSTHDMLPIEGTFICFEIPLFH